jgi:hypothetical protein
VINHLWLIIDKCPSCKSVFISDPELAELLEDAEDDGHASGMITGIAIGIST